jgi:hypothetical protein
VALTGAALTAKDRIRDAAAGILERALTALVSDGQLQVKGRPGAVALRLANRLQDVDLLSLTGQTAIALELVASDWPPIAGDLAEASLHGIHLGGIVLSGEDNHIADYLRVVEAQHSGKVPTNLEEYRHLAQRIRAVYLEATPDHPLNRG